jgi:hypothetical protein
VAAALRDAAVRGDLDVTAPLDAAGAPPASRARALGVTVDLLLGHRSGLPEFPAIQPSMDLAWDEYARAVLVHSSLLFDPGRYYSYSTVGYFIAAWAAMKAMGVPWGELLLGAFGESPDAARAVGRCFPPHHAAPFSLDREGLPHWLTVAGAALRANPLHVVRLLHADVRRRVASTHAVAAVIPYGYSAGCRQQDGWMIRETRRGPAFFIEGSQPGYSANVVSLPELDVTICVVGSGPYGRAQIAPVVDAALVAIAGFRWPVRVDACPAVDTPVHHGLAGVYRNGAATIKVTALPDGQLAVRRLSPKGRPYRVRPVGELTFERVVGGRRIAVVQFERFDGGPAEYAFVEGRAFRRTALDARCAVDWKSK